MASKIGRFFARRYSSAVPKDPKKVGYHPGAEETMKLWEKLAMFVAAPALVLAFINVFGSDHEVERPEFIPYDHLRVRTKKFPWGDGNHSLFHNPKVNALPDGYEE